MSDRAEPSERLAANDLRRDYLSHFHESVHSLQVRTFTKLFVPKHRSTDTVFRTPNAVWSEPCVWCNSPCAVGIAAVGSYISRQNARSLRAVVAYRVVSWSEQCFSDASLAVASAASLLVSDVSLAVASAAPLLVPGDPLVVSGRGPACRL